MPSACLTSGAPRRLLAGQIGIAARRRPMQIERCRAEGPLAFIEAGTQAGHAHVADHNAFRQEGVHVTQRNVHEGIRWSTFASLPACAAPRPNLDVATCARATGMVFQGTRIGSGQAPPG